MWPYLTLAWNMSTGPLKFFAGLCMSVNYHESVPRGLIWWLQTNSRQEIQNQLYTEDQQFLIWTEADRNGKSFNFEESKLKPSMLSSWGRLAPNAVFVRSEEKPEGMLSTEPWRFSETVKCDSDHPQISKELQETFKVRVTTKTTMKKTTTTQLHSVRLTFVSLNKLKARITTATISPKFSLTGTMFQILPKVKNKRKGWNNKVCLQELKESLFNYRKVGKKSCLCQITVFYSEFQDLKFSLKCCFFGISATFFKDLLFGIHCVQRNQILCKSIYTLFKREDHFTLQQNSPLRREQTFYSAIGLNQYIFSTDIWVSGSGATPYMSCMIANRTWPSFPLRSWYTLSMLFGLHDNTLAWDTVLGHDQL